LAITIIWNVPLSTITSLNFTLFFPESLPLLFIKKIVIPTIAETRIMPVINMPLK
jgi:hypothetical protein